MCYVSPSAGPSPGIQFVFIPDAHLLLCVAQLRQLYLKPLHCSTVALL